jgi:hypothetical protein
MNELSVKGRVDTTGNHRSFQRNPFPYGDRMSSLLDTYRSRLEGSQPTGMQPGALALSLRFAAVSKAFWAQRVSRPALVEGEPVET